jgi:CHASE3 domain sensor protein
MIRDLRAKLAQLMRELRAVQADDSMNPEARRIRLQQIQAQMSALNGALIAATQKLAALMRDIRLGKGQQMAAAQLALR